MKSEFARKKNALREPASLVPATQRESKGAGSGLPRFLKSRNESPDTQEGWQPANANVHAAEAHHEQAADRLAEHSLNPADSKSGSRPEQLGSPPVSSGAPGSSTISGPGDPLPESERQDFEKSMNADFSGVRIHHDTESGRAADSLNALAFTENRDISFGPGQYQPATSEGRRLLAHELAHVKQQSTGEVSGVQRDPIPGTEKQPAPPAPVADEASPTSDFFNREEVENIRGRTTARYFKTSTTVSSGIQTIGKIKDTLMEVNERYNEAYTNYSTAIRAGGREARNQQEWRDFFIGLGIGITMGLGSELLLPAEAASWLELTVEVGTEVAEGAAGMAVKSSGWTTVVGQDLAPPRGLDPMVLELDIYRLIESLHHSVFDVARYCDSLFLINGAAEYAIGEIKAHVAGGEQEMTQLDLLDLIDALVAADQSGAALEKQLASFAASLNDIKSRVESAPRQNVGEMEQDIWILWMSAVTDDDSDVIDLDAIENRLLAAGVIGPSSRLNVDFGWYTSEDDELAALKAARAEAPLILSRRKELTSTE